MVIDIAKRIMHMIAEIKLVFRIPRLNPIKNFKKMSTG
jgi:hypothetical protein